MAAHPPSKNSVSGAFYDRVSGENVQFTTMTITFVTNSTWHFRKINKINNKTVLVLYPRNIKRQRKMMKMNATNKPTGGK